VTVGANSRFKAMPRYHNNLRRGRRPRRRLLVCCRILRQTTAPCCVGASAALVYLRALRVGTRGCGATATAGAHIRICAKTLWRPPRNAVVSPLQLVANGMHLLAAPHSAGRGAGWLRQILVATHRYLLFAHRAQARQSAILSGFGRTDTYTCTSATCLSPKAASLVPFLPRQERNRPPRRRKASRSCQASPQLQTPQPRRTAVRTLRHAQLHLCATTSATGEQALSRTKQTSSSPQENVRHNPSAIVKQKPPLQPPALKQKKSAPTANNRLR
jgi:hypothetical protein